ncbi:ligand-binding sensor domain-containing protein [Chitinophaga oryziterrae]|nr:two-component regulator propeller domain-containing protein [Chitinophaga oryziterrae]
MSLRRIPYLLMSYTAFLRISVCLLLLPFITVAQTSFHLSTDNGLSGKLLTVLTRDHLNNMWFGSYNGLYKHEGARIKWYNRVGNDSLSLSGGELHALFEDKEGNMWIGTTGGLDRMNMQSGIIQHYVLTSLNNSSSLGYIYSIFEDKKHYLWISTDAGLFRMDKNSGRYHIIAERKDNKGIPSPIAQYHCMVDTDKGFWLSTASGLVYYEYSSGDFYHHYNNPAKDPVFNLNFLTGTNTSDLCKDSQQNIWFVANSHLLAKYNLNTHRLDTFKFERPKDAWPYCYSLIADFKDNIWIGFRHGGLQIFNTDNNTFTVIHKEDNNKILHSDYIYSLCEDYLHKMWVTTDEGIDIIDYYNDAVQTYNLSNAPDFTSLKYVSGMMSYDPWKKRVYIPFSQKRQLFWFDETTKKIQSQKQLYTTLYVWPVENGRLLKGKSRSFYETGNGVSYYPKELADTPYEIIWAARAHGISYFKKQSGMLYRYAHNKLEVIPSVQFMKQACISADSQFLYFIDHAENLARQNIITGIIERFDLQSQSKALHFSFSDPRDIIDDGKGSIWVTSQNGLLKYNPRDRSLEVFTTAHGLSHSFTFALLIDNAKRLWVCSLGGVDWYDSLHRTFHNVISNPNSTYMDAFCSGIRGKDGSLYFQAGNKLYHIVPEEYFKYHAIQPVLRLNKALVDEDRRLTIEYSLLDFERPEKVHYYYRLDGVDHNWIDNGNHPDVFYNNLRPGNYTLNVHAVTEGGLSDIKDLTFDIRITPAFWQTNLFEVIVILLIMSLIFFLCWWWVFTIKRKADLQQQMSELEARAIRAQMHPHFIFNSLNAIQELIVLEDMPSAYLYLSKFSKLLRMVLHHSEHNLISLNDEIEMNRLYLDLEALRFKKSFQYTITVSERIDDHATIVPSLLLQPFIENAIWHGLMSKHGDKKLTINFTENNETLICEITDNGIGREAAGNIKARKIGNHNFDSKGMLLGKQRINLMNACQGWTSSVDIIDLKDVNGLATGTTIRIILQQPV